MGSRASVIYSSELRAELFGSVADDQKKLEHVVQV